MLERLGNSGPVALTTLDNDGDEVNEYVMRVRDLIEDTIDYEQSFLAPTRDQAVKYYYGMLPTLGGEDEFEDIVGDPDVRDGDLDNVNDANRSTIVSTDVRDAILTILPSLIRIFGASEKVVNFIARTEQGADAAQQATEYINYLFWNDNQGFLTLYSVFKDALMLKAGFVKWWTDNNKEIKKKTFQNITIEQAKYIISLRPDVTVIDFDADEQTGVIKRFVVSYEESKPVVKSAAVPPDEMRVDRFAKSFKDSRIVGHECVVPIETLTAMGYDEDMLRDYIVSSDSVNNYSDERQIRNAGLNMSTAIGDGIQYGEWYIRVDKDNDGVAELRHICTIGDDRFIVHDEPANRIKFAHFSVDPRPHTIIGDSIADLVKDIQKIKTNILRGVLDNLAESSNPKTVVNELTTNIDDALNDDLGAVIRTRGDPAAAVAFSRTPFIGADAMPLMDSLDMLLSRRTGLSDAAKGLDPKALQSSATIGVDAIISGAQERIELIARVLAETGYATLMKGLFDEVCENPNETRVLPIRGKYITFDTSLFDESMGVEVNPTLGKGSDMVRVQALLSVKNDQMMIIEKFGINNPIVSPVEVLNTITDLLELANIKNVGRYFKPVTPEIMAAISQTPTEPDPLAVSAKAQMEKVKSDTAKAISSSQNEQDRIAQQAKTSSEQIQAQRDIAASNNATQLLIKQLDMEIAKTTALAEGTGAGEG